MRVLLVSALLLAASTAAVPLASANTAECDFDRDNAQNVAERVTCTVVGVVLNAGFEAVQCVVHGDGDLC